MARLEAAIEGKTAELVAQASGQPVTEAVRILSEDEIAKAAAAA